MADEAQSELTLAGLRRRGAPRGGQRGGPRRGSSDVVAVLFQHELFADLEEMPAGTAFEQTVPAAMAPASLPAALPAELPETLPEEIRRERGAMNGAGRAVQIAERVQAVRQEITVREVSAQVLAAPVAVASPPAVPEAEPAPQPWTVSGLVRHVRNLVERGYGQVTVEGEISNWRPAGSGHCYFTVKDAEAQLSAVMFRRQASLLRFRPSDGDAVRLRAQVSVYESRGQMQLIVEWMEQMGFGALLAALQRLKEKLRGEGLFDRKRALPAFPRCIGVVTSLQGAALRDIVKVCRRRHAAVQLLIYPAAVQGPNCAAEVAAGLRWFNAHPDRAEVVLVARGGGSWEDLHGFDDEAVVRGIAGSVLPVITGLGHATDSTLADLAADQCAPTPSAAAELLTAAQHRVEEHVDRLHGRLRRAASFELVRAQGRLARLSAAAVLRRIEDRLDRRAQALDDLQFRLLAAQRQRMERNRVFAQRLQAQLEQRNPAVQLAASQRRLEALQMRLQGVMAVRRSAAERRIERAVQGLEALSPLRVLERGYALVYGEDGHLLRSSKGSQDGDRIQARLAEGVLYARVVE